MILLPIESILLYIIDKLIHSINNWKIQLKTFAKQLFLCIVWQQTLGILLIDQVNRLVVRFVLYLFALLVYFLCSDTISSNFWYVNTEPLKPREYIYKSVRFFRLQWTEVYQLLFFYHRHSCTINSNIEAIHGIQ